jgi:phenylalanyl-tRNA synthetase beta chain
MPKIVISLKDLEGLYGKKIPSEKLASTLEYAKAEIDELSGDVLKVDCKDPNRPDLWSTEGLARELKKRTGIKKGLLNYTTTDSGIKIIVDKNLKNIRPLSACAVVRNVKITPELLEQLIQIQEKVCENYGRKRKEVALGLYDLGIIKPPIYYKGFKDNEIEFVPLEWKVKMKPSEILTQHEKGKAYGHLLKDAKYYPILIDSNNVVASMPPIINSDATGKVTEKTKELFVEVSGFKMEIIETALEIILMALADRGGKIEKCTVEFPENEKPYPQLKISTPTFGIEKMNIEKEYIMKKTGLELKDAELKDLLERAGYDCTIKGNSVEVKYNAYRQDILHAVDVIEDILISYGFNNIKPQKIEMDVTGSQRKEVEFEEMTRDGCIGLGLQEIITTNLTSKKIQAENILLNPEKENFVEILNFVSLNYQIMRKRLFPEVLNFLAKNKSREYPQKIFEIGTRVVVDESKASGARQSTALCIAISHSNANYTEIKSILDFIAHYLNKKIIVKKKNFEFLGENAIEVSGELKGFAGELKKEVMENFGLKQPVTLIEIELYEEK